MATCAARFLATVYNQTSSKVPNTNNFIPSFIRSLFLKREKVESGSISESHLGTRAATNSNSWNSDYYDYPSPSYQNRKCRGNPDGGSALLGWKWIKGGKLQCQ